MLREELKNQLLTSIDRQDKVINREIKGLNIKNQERGKSLRPLVGKYQNWGPIKYRVTKKGDQTTYPRRRDQVTVQYTGKFRNGKIFDSSLTKGRPFTFRVGEGQVIKGWDLIIPNLSLGEEVKVIIPPQLAYGEKGAGNGVIPPNSTLLFKIKLLAISNN